MRRPDLQKWVFSKKRSLIDVFSRDAMQVDTETTPDIANVMATKTTFVARGNEFCVDKRYSYIKTLGLGAYGVVCAVQDSVSKKKVAVKKVAGVFNDLTDAKRIIRETRLLSRLNHDNILNILDVDAPVNYDMFADVYIVTELMDTDLNKLLRSNVVLQDSQRMFFAYQLFAGLNYIHSANILHRDLKPANILVSEKCDIKICDFGLARYVDPSDNEAQNMTEYVVTRWYRAPELLVAGDEYTAAIDMWSAGCVIAEFYTRQPLFPGRDVKHQIQLICQMCGKPTESEMSAIQNLKARHFIKNLPPSKRQNFQNILPRAPPEAVDLVSRLLQFDPKKRMSVTEALQHPYCEKYREPERENGRVGSMDMLEPPSETRLGAAGIRRLMWEEILRFHPEAASRETAAAKEAEKNVRYVESHP